MKHSRNWRRDKADKLYQTKLKALNPRCLVCGNPTQVIHHVVPKSLSNRLRYDEKNGAWLCNGCHTKHHHGDPAIHWTIGQRWGKTQMNYLEKVRRDYVKTDVLFYEQAIKKLSQ